MLLAHVKSIGCTARVETNVGVESGSPNHTRLGWPIDIIASAVRSRPCLCALPAAIFSVAGEMEAREMSDHGNLSQKIVGIAAGEAHTLALTGDGRVYSWGRGMFGRLGTGKESDEVAPVRVMFDSSLKKETLSTEDGRRERPRFVQVAAGAYHSLALEDDGSIWSWGYNTYGQLGFSTENSSTPCFLKQFLEMASAGSLNLESNSNNKTELKACSIKAGGMMSLAIDNLGSLWMWGNCPPQTDKSDGEFTLVSTAIPVPVWDFHGHTVVKVACGNEHVVALVSAGETHRGDDLICYSWGNNNHGQLGHGDTESRSRPQIVETFNQESSWEIYEIACGGSHSAVLSKRKAHAELDSSGDRECRCWTFGLGENGQLGHGTANSTSSPQPIEGLPQDANLISVDCGLFHTCVVSSSGNVWAWGMQNGRGLCPDVRFSGMEAGDALYPLAIKSGESNGGKFVDPVQVACGAAHTVLASDNGYELWAWGRGRSGVLGRGDAIDSLIPCRAVWPPLETGTIEEEKGSEPVNGEEKLEGNESERVLDLEKRLATATEQVQSLESKLALMERYAGVLHASVFGKPFQEQDIPSSLLMWGVFNVEKEWESILGSADREKLIRMEAFHRGMLAGVKDMLLKRRIEELIKQCMRS